MTIDEAIECERNHRLYPEYHEQIAEWLEELKAIKSDGFTDDLLNMGFTKGYKKALDDVESEFLMCDKVHYNLQDILCVIHKSKAPQTKEPDTQ